MSYRLFRKAVTQLAPEHGEILKQMWEALRGEKLRIDEAVSSRVENFTNYDNESAKSIVIDHDEDMDLD